MARSRVALTVLVLLVLGGASAAPGQDTRMRPVGSFTGASGRFHGVLGTESMQTYLGRSLGVPSRTLTTNYAPLAPSSSTAIFRRSVGGVGASYRVTGSLQTGLGSAETRAYGPTRVGQPFGGPPPGRLGVPLGSPGPTLPYLPPPPGLPTLEIPLAADGQSEVELGGGFLSAQPPRRMAYKFDLAGQLKANDYWRQGAELLREGRFQRALQEIRLGLVFSVGRAEGEWLMAVAQAGAEDYGAAVYRLRNVIAVFPDLLGTPRGVSSLLGRATVERRMHVEPPGDAADQVQPSAERLLVAAWLAVETDQFRRAAELLSRARELTAGATTVAAALRQAVAPDATGSIPPREVGAGSVPSPRQGRGRAVAALPGTGPSLSLGQWLADRGALMGLPPPDSRYLQGRLQAAP